MTTWVRRITLWDRFGVWLFGLIKALDWTIVSTSAGREYVSYNILRLNFSLALANRFCRSYCRHILGRKPPKIIVDSVPCINGKVAKNHVGCYIEDEDTIHIFMGDKYGCHWGTLVHEMAHLTHMNHGLGFRIEMHRIWYYSMLLNLTHRRVKNARNS